MADRRSGKDRRARHLIPEPLERRGDRRHGDRRESPRLPATLEVDDGTGRVTVDGELGLGGASFSTRRPPGDELVVRCPAVGAAFEARAWVLRREVRGSATTLHVRFAELPLELELLLARWLDDGAKR